MTPRRRGRLAAAAAGAGALGLAGVRALRPKASPGAGPPAPGPHISADTAGYRGGSGTPLLLLHGFSATWRAWKPILPLLERHHDVIAPTMLGHSGADPLADGVAPSVDALVDGVIAELDRLGLDKVHVVGNSLGGWIALEVARRGRARSVVALAPGGAWHSNARMAVAVTSLRVMLYGAKHHQDLLEKLVSRQRIRYAMLAPVVARPERVAVEDFIADLRSIKSAPVLLQLLRSVTQHPLRPLPDPGCPVRIVWGDQDRLIPFEHFGRPMLARVPDAELVMMHRVGHVPMWDEPEKTTELILEVTGKIDLSRPGGPPGTPSAASSPGDARHRLEPRVDP
ncbi:MAG TPA: alpha/beta fold hydrolase [Pseudonocardia sp.]|nr:alpha/beta fold hydrolase [Pseudonocardia sp.]